MQENESYQRVACHFYDQLEVWATFKQKIKINFKPKAPFQESMISVIETLETLNKSEYLILVNGYKIRLDHILSIDEM